jgi:UPF0716 protein FxsA
MLLKLILLLTIVPLVELFILVRLAQATSFLFTLCVVLGTGVVGAAVARIEGLRVLARMQEQLDRGELPADSILDGVLILLAAALLVTPGLITDACGFLLLVPPTRRLVRRWLKGWVMRRITTGQGGFHAMGGYRPIHDQPPPGAPPLEDEDERR